MTNANPAGDENSRPDVTDEDPAGETFAVEHDGQVYDLPAALRGAFLRQADYTRKTQDLAQHRRALLEERAIAAQQTAAAQGALSDKAHLAALDNWVGHFARIDWPVLARQDPQRAEALWARFQQTRALRHHYGQAVQAHQARSRAAAAQRNAANMAATGQTLSREIEGWSPELAARLVDYARGHGVTLEELGAADDPRVWKIIHCAYKGDCAKQEDGAAVAAAKAQLVRPAVTVGGGRAAGGGVRDELATKEWMKRRNEQMRKAR